MTKAGTRSCDGERGRSRRGEHRPFERPKLQARGVEFALLFLGTRLSSQPPLASGSKAAVEADREPHFGIRWSSNAAAKPAMEKYKLPPCSQSSQKLLHRRIFALPSNGKPRRRRACRFL